MLVEANGGYVKFVEGQWRVNGRLSMSRSLGDNNMQGNGICCIPHIYQFSTKNAQYIMLASDGLYEQLTVQQVDRLVRAAAA